MATHSLPMMRALLLLGVALAAGSCGVKLTDGTCKQDSDCSKGMLCESQRCKPAGLVERQGNQIGAPAASPSSS